jgi:hypothetical protein
LEPVISLSNFDDRTGSMGWLSSGAAARVHAPARSPLIRRRLGRCDAYELGFRQDALVEHNELASQSPRLGVSKMRRKQSFVRKFWRTFLSLFLN